MNKIFGFLVSFFLLRDIQEISSVDFYLGLKPWGLLFTFFIKKRDSFFLLFLLFPILSQRWLFLFKIGFVTLLPTIGKHDCHIPIVLHTMLYLEPISPLYIESEVLPFGIVEFESHFFSIKFDQIFKTLAVLNVNPVVLEKPEVAYLRTVKEEVVDLFFGLWVHLDGPKADSSHSLPPYILGLDGCPDGAADVNSREDEGVVVLALVDLVVPVCHDPEPFDFDVHGDGLVFVLESVDYYC